MRGRGSAGRTAASAFSYASSVTRFARSPIACIHDLKAAAERLLGETLRLLGRRHVEAAVAGRVAVVGEKGGAARAERAVRDDLEGANGEAPD